MRQKRDQGLEIAFLVAVLSQMTLVICSETSVSLPRLAFPRLPPQAPQLRLDCPARRSIVPTTKLEGRIGASIDK